MDVGGSNPPSPIFNARTLGFPRVFAFSVTPCVSKTPLPGVVRAGMRVAFWKLESSVCRSCLTVMATEIAKPVTNDVRREAFLQFRLARCSQVMPNSRPRGQRLSQEVRAVFLSLAVSGSQTEAARSSAAMTDSQAAVTDASAGAVDSQAAVGPTEAGAAAVEARTADSQAGTVRFEE